MTPEILYEDNHVIVALKPPNLLSQADRTGDGDLLGALKEYIREKYRKPGEVYLGLVHRLDRPVGGLMVFARTSKAAARLSAQLQQHDVGREYLCVCEGLIDGPLNLTDWLLKDKRLNHVAVVAEGTPEARKAVLHCTPLQTAGALTLCAIRLETGRSHQIRVQMAHAGHALWGDNRYGSGIPGQQVALWGYRLTFEHPVSHRMMTFERMPRGGIWGQFEMRETTCASPSPMSFSTSANSPAHVWACCTPRTATFRPPSTCPWAQPPVSRP